jgi:topoisomerase (DNA) II binding protein 1
VFLLSGDEDQSAAETTILSLGGQVVRGRAYDGTCTHLLFDALKRTEKLACGLAAGKWILHTSYLKDSLEAGHFLTEEPYEWGSGHGDGSSSTTGRVWEGSPRYWREQREQHGCGPFSHWRVSLYSTAKFKMVPPIDLCHRLLEAGGAAVVCIRPPYDIPQQDEGNESGSQLTRVAFMAEGLGRSKQALKFKKAGVECVKPAYTLSRAPHAARSR